MQSTSWETLGWRKHELESRLLGEISITSDMQMTPPLWQKSLLMKVKVESKKVGLKLNIQKTKIMASGPITSWQIDGGKVETVTDFIFLGSKITANSDCSHEIKTLTPWKTSYDKSRQHIKKRRHHFADKDLYSQNYGFSSSYEWMGELDHKKTECRTEFWCWRRLLRVR